MDVMGWENRGKLLPYLAAAKRFKVVMLVSKGVPLAAVPGTQVKGAKRCIAREAG